MTTNPPFKISAEAERRLASAATVRNMEPGIVREFRFEAFGKQGELTDSFDAEHYSIAFNTLEAWASDKSAIQATIAGRTFWLPFDTVENLKGRTLTLLRRYEGEKQAGKIQDVLVAI